MELSITTKDGLTAKHPVQPDETFIELKERVQQKFGIVLDLNAVIINGKRLNESLKVGDYFSYGKNTKESTTNTIMPDDRPISELQYYEDLIAMLDSIGESSQVNLNEGNLTSTRLLTNNNLESSCKVCLEKFESETRLELHMKLHCSFGEDSSSRTVSSDWIKQKHELQIDELDSIKPYQCPHCSKQFKLKGSIIKHIRMHTGEKPFLCDLCGKGFSQSSGLNTHKKFHSNLRPFACPHCSNRYKIKGDLNAHIKIHSGKRSYKCELCDKEFQTPGVFYQHKRIHTGERPYKCDDCNAAFARSFALTEHRRTHSSEKPYLCDICDKRFKYKGSFRKHRSALHGL